MLAPQELKIKYKFCKSLWKPKK